jgi:hypothetical protein
VFVTFGNRVQEISLEQKHGAVLAAIKSQPKRVVQPA